MSDTENTEGEDNEEQQVTLYVCRKCPGKSFSESERAEHRKFHKELKKNQRVSPRNSKKPGPKSKTKAKGRRAISPTPSIAGTLFSIVNDTDPMSASNRKKRAADKLKEQMGNPKNKRKRNGA